jgi:hypothetical protein
MSRVEARDALGRLLRRGDRVMRVDAADPWSGCVVGVSRAGRVLVEDNGDRRLATMDPSRLLQQRVVTQWPAAAPTGGTLVGTKHARRKTRAWLPPVFDGRGRRIGLRDHVEHADGRRGVVVRLVPDGRTVTVAWVDGGGTAEVAASDVVLHTVHLTGGPQ